MNMTYELINFSLTPRNELKRAMVCVCLCVCVWGGDAREVFFVSWVRCIDLIMFEVLSLLCKFFSVFYLFCQQEMQTSPRKEKLSDFKS